METVERCLESLKASRSDNERLAAIMVISKVCNRISIGEDLTTQLYEAISPAFLLRLMKPNPSEPTKNAFKSLAINILSYFGKTSPSLLVKDVNILDQLTKELLDVFNLLKTPEDIPLFNNVFDLLISIARFDVGANVLLKNNVYSILNKVILEEDLEEKVFSLLNSLLLHSGGLNEDFMKYVNSICHNFQSNQELLKFKYLGIVTKVFQLILKCKQNLDYKKSGGVIFLLKNICMASKDILQSHLKADVKRSTITLLCTIMKVCGNEWIFDIQCVNPVSNFVILLLVNISIELQFLLQSKITDVCDSSVIESGLYIAENVLNFICSISFEQNSLTADNNFILKVFSCFKNIMRTIYGFLLRSDGCDLSFKHPVVISTVSMLSRWATEETENLREELRQVLPVLATVGKKDIENIIQNNATPTLLRLMAPLVAQTIPDDQMRRILVSTEYHHVYVMYLSHILTDEKAEPETGTLEMLFHIVHQFMILEPKLCTENSNLKELSENVLNFVSNVPTNIHLSSYSCLELIIVSLRFTRMYKMEYNNLLEEVIKYSIRYVYEATDKPLEEGISDIWFIAVQNIISFYRFYKQKINIYDSLSYLKGWCSKSTVNEDMKIVINELIQIIG